MEDSYASLVSNFIMDPDRLSDDDLDDVELDDEEEEEEEEVDDDFYDFLPFQKEFLMPLRDRAFSWDVSLEDGLHGENMHLFAPTTTTYDNNPKLVIKAKRMQVTKQDSDIIPLPIKMEKDMKKPSNNNKANVATKKGNENDSSTGKNDSVSSPKLSFVLSKSSSNSSCYTLKNTNSSSGSTSISGTGNSTALAMKPPTRLPSQGNAALASLSRMTAANNFNKSQPVSAISSEKQVAASNQVVSSASVPITTTDIVDSTSNNYMQLQEEQPQLAKHNAEIAQEIQALFDYAGGAGDDISDQMFDNSVRNLERIMMHPDESDEDHQRRHAMEMLADQQNLAASSSSPQQQQQQQQQQQKQEINPQLASTPQSSLNSMLGTSGSSKGPLQGGGGLLGAGGLTGMNGALGGGQMGGLRPMILDGFNNLNDHLLGGGPSPLHHMQRVHGLQPFGSFGGGGGLNNINGNNLSNHILTMNNMSGAGLGGTLGGPLSGGMHAHSTGSSSGLGGEYRVGAYTREERQMKIEAFRAKKRKRIWRKQIKYDCRKRLADTRPRVKGRFVSRKLGEGDDLIGGGLMDENGDYLMGGGDGSGGGGSMLNRHMLLDPHTGLLMGGIGGMNNMNNMMFMNNLGGVGGGGGLASLNSLAAGGMYGGLLPGQQQMPYGGGINFGGPMLGGMDGSMGGFPQQQPVRQKKNRNHHNNSGGQNSGMTGGGVGGLSSKDLMNFQIQQRYANAVYSGGNSGTAGAGGDLMFNPQAGLGVGNLDFLNNAMLPGPGNQQQMFMPPLDFTSGPGGLLSIKAEGSVGGGSGAATNLFNDQMAMLLQQQQQQLLYIQSLNSNFNNNNSSSNSGAVNLGGELGGAQMTGNGGPTDGFQQLQQQLLQQQQQHQHQQNVLDVKNEDAAAAEEEEQEERAAAEEDDDEDDEEEEEDVHEE